VVDNRRLELECMAATAELAPIRAGQRVTFRVTAHPDREFEGRVIDINPMVEAATRSAKVRIGVENTSRLLRSGMFAQGEILTGVQSQAVTIPASAAYRDDRGSKNSYVFVIDDGRAVRRQVRIGRERDSMLEIVDGLKAGDVLVAEQSIEIAEGVALVAESPQARK
jgi:RND family efflux transporter MFP subunit